AQLAQRLEVRQPLEEQDAVRQLVGVLHLVDRFLVLVLGEIFEAPVLQHLGVQEVLVDRGELVVERLVEVLDDLGIALHGWLRLEWMGAGTLAPSRSACRNANRDHPASAGAVARVWPDQAALASGRTCSTRGAPREASSSSSEAAT